VLVDPELRPDQRRSLESEWHQTYARRPLFREFERPGRFVTVHLDLFDGQWEAPVWDDGGGPDTFEIEIGNGVAHAVPLRESGAAFPGSELLAKAEHLGGLLETWVVARESPAACGNGNR
jgi:hypothetical protein